MATGVLMIYCKKNKERDASNGLTVILYLSSNFFSLQLEVFGIGELESLRYFL